MADKKELLKDIDTLEQGTKVSTRQCEATTSISILSLCTSVILAVFIIPKIMFLYRDFYTLEAELIQQKRLLLTILGQKNDSIDNLYDRSAEQLQLDIVHRNIRSARPGRKRGDNRRPNNNNRRSNRGRNSNNSNTQQIKAIHLDIDKHHPRRNRQEEDLKTGQRFEPIRYWKISDHDFNYDQQFAELSLPDGYVTIQESGLYMIYSQMTYFDRSGRWSHVITIEDTPFIKCLASEWGINTDPDTGLHYNTIHQCYTSAVTHIQANKKVYVRGMYPDRIIHEDKDLTFWGIIKLS